MKKLLLAVLVAFISVALFAVSDSVLVMAIETEPVGFDPTLVLLLHLTEFLRMFMMVF